MQSNHFQEKIGRLFCFCCCLICCVFPAIFALSREEEGAHIGSALNVNNCFLICYGVSQVVQWIKNPPAMQEVQETQVQSLGQEDILEEGMATHSSIPAWRIPRTEESGVIQSMRLKRVRYD